MRRKWKAQRALPGPRLHRKVQRLAKARAIRSWLDSLAQLLPLPCSDSFRVARVQPSLEFYGHFIGASPPSSIVDQSFTSFHRTLVKYVLRHHLPDLATKDSLRPSSRRVECCP